MSMETGNQLDRSTNTDVNVAACVTKIILFSSKSSYLCTPCLDTVLIDPENPPDPPLAPFSRINQTNGRLVYEEGESLEMVFPLPGKCYTSLILCYNVMSHYHTLVYAHYSVVQ